MKATHLFIGLFTLTLASCGGGEKPKADAGKAPAQSMIESEKPAEPNNENEVELVLSSNDQMQYDKTELRVKEGQEVTLVLKHTGKMPKSTMGHNFVLLQEGTDMAAFAAKAMEAPDADYIPEGDEIIVHTSTIGGGETTSITFNAPAKGTYQYLCSFPAHYALMNGKFIVE